MAQCTQCGAEGLKWETVLPTRGFRLTEPEGGLHVCRPEDKLKNMCEKSKSLKRKKKRCKSIETKTAIYNN